MAKERLDILLVERGLAGSRERAKRMIMAGEVLVDGQKIDKAGTTVKPEAEIRLLGHDIPYVSRGGLKLEKAMKEFGVRLQDKVAADIGASTGGTDIVAMIINKYRTVSYGKILIYSDFVIIGSALLVGMGISAVIYGYVMTAVVGYTVDMIMAGNQQSSQVFIVTHDYEKMAQAIVDNVHRGVTLIDSQGWYSKKESKIVMVVCRKRETSMILKFVKTIDPEAFMTVGSVMGVYGKGFQTIGKG